MSSQPNNPSKLAYSSQCVPGSAAEQKEKERLAAFQKAKAERKAEEERNRPEEEARREQAYIAATEANRNRMHKGRAQSYNVTRPADKPAE